jgi:hypothetical protein
MNKGYWVAIYNNRLFEYDGEEGNFGNLGGLIYETPEEAINAVKNDIEEYKKGLKGKVKVIKDDKHYCYHCYENDKLVCSWSIQFMRMSKEANELD